MSPIIGMTRREDVTPRFPELGKLHKGAKKVSDDRPGADLDHWRFASERPEVLAAFAKLYPGEPKVIRVYLPFQNVADNFATWQEEWSNGGLVHRCDGQVMSRWRNARGTWDDGEKPCPYFTGEQQRVRGDKEKGIKAVPGCTAVGRLTVIVPELFEMGFVGYITMGTTSKNDVISITASLLETEQRAGRLNGIMFDLYRVKERITTPGWTAADIASGKRLAVVKDLVKITPNAEFVLRQMVREREALAQLIDARPALLLAGLPTPEVVTESTWEDIEEGDFDVEPEPNGTPETAETDPPAAALNDEWGEMLALFAGVTVADDVFAAARLAALQGLVALLPRQEARRAFARALLGSDNKADWTYAQVAALAALIALDGAGVPSARSIQWAKVLVPPQE